MTRPVPVLLYTRTGCPYCDAKRTELVARGLAFREVNLSDTPARLSEFLKLTGGVRTVPVIVEGAVVRVAPEGGTSF